RGAGRRMGRAADLLDALIVPRVGESVCAGEREPVERPELAGHFHALTSRGAGEIVDGGLEARQRLQNDLVLQPRVEIGYVDEDAPVPELLFPARIPADRAFRHETGIRNKRGGEEA